MSTTVTTTIVQPQSTTQTQNAPIVKLSPYIVGDVRKDLRATVLHPSKAPTPQTRVRILIDDRWYDLTHFQNVHPGGHQILHYLNGQDATDAFYSLHSKEAVQRLQKLKTVSTPAKPNDVPPPTKATLAFRQFRKDLAAQGFFERSLFWEIFYPLHIFILAAIGTWLAFNSHPILASIAIGFAMQQAGWVGHDYVHGRGNQQFYCGRLLSGAINAFSATWWSNKHNTHHVYTNHVGVDVDIENDPIFHLFVPSLQEDIWFRRYQHYYFPVVASVLFVSWRIQSLQWAIGRSKYSEIALMLPNFIWLYFLGLPIALSSIIIAGFFVAIVVTVTHQSEDMIDIRSQPYSFVECQFATTRDAECGNFLMNWFWGGMQYQLEHHLFPTIPKYYYNKLRPLVRQWAKENGIEYRIESEWAVWRRNFETLKLCAQPLDQIRKSQ